MEEYQKFQVYSDEYREPFFKKFLRMIKRILLLCFIAGICIAAGFIIFAEKSEDWISEKQYQINLLQDPPPDSSVTLYSWIDKNGSRRYSDQKPKDPELQVTEIKGYTYQDESFFKKSFNAIKTVWQKIKGYYKQFAASF